MATNINLYDKYRKRRLDPTGAAITGTLKLALVSASYAPNQSTDEFWSTVSAHEVSGAGYTAGGAVLGSPTATIDGAGNLTFDAADPADWPQSASGFSAARRAVLYFDTGTPGTSALLAYSDDFGANVGNIALTLTINLNAAGIYTSAR